MRLLAELGHDHGISMRACLNGTGVRQRDLSDPLGVVSAEQELQLIRNLLAHRGGCPALGTQAGTRYHFTAYGMLGFAMASSSTLRSAFDISVKYSQLTFAFSQFKVKETERDSHILVDTSDIPEELHQFIIERDIAALLTVQRDLFSAQTILHNLYFSFPSPGRFDLYEAVYGVKPIFGSIRTMAEINRGALRQPLPQANEFALKSAEEQCQLVLERRLSETGLIVKVRDRLLHGGVNLPDMKDVAKDLCVTPRTLHRHLEKEGVTFLELRDDVRLTLAENLLKNRNLLIKDIASHLGYSCATSFISAFKRWKGMTPLMYRKRFLAKFKHDRKGP